MKGEDDMFVKIDTDNYKEEVTEAKCPLLLAYICKDHSYLEQEKVLRNVAKRFEGALKVCLINQGFSGILHQYQIQGSPTFIFFLNGKEKGRVLGRTGKDRLINHVLKFALDVNLQKAAGHQTHLLHVDGIEHGHASDNL